MAMSVSEQETYILCEYMRYLQHKSHRINMFDRHSGELSSFYHSQVLPLINESTMGNREQHFFEWLIQSKLIVPGCINRNENHLCKISGMSLLKSLTSNEYKWLCQNCSSKMPVKDRSIFKGINCDLKTGMRILFGWAKGENIETMAKLLGIKYDIVGTIYNRAADVILRHINSNPTLNIISGIVLIDIYPNFALNKKWILGAKPEIKPILCITEIQSLPQKFWLQSVAPYDTNSPESLENVRRQILEIVLQKVAPSSTILLKVASSITFSEKELTSLNSTYNPVITNVDKLAQHNFGNRTLESALETILQRPLSICEEAQFFSPEYIDQFLIRSATNQLAGGDHFRYLIEIIFNSNINFFE